ncbi:hypothetical protein H7K24_18745 [Mycobacterium fragae]|uniref:Uncharacterized protein n=1 Tax=Mycobacterium fragae TaxID=1260918 RepID=A0A1X1USC7_9MYCO|nr:hypothetical protein [Mycobacterium fragae]MCV7402178.1 hypothetical protein [Mycobacterium fragae]ORV59579.1 hypothetical protein AWC06_15705 [Mycobacterium fragae]
MTAPGSAEKAATRSERVTIRPFSQIDVIDGELDSVQLVVGGDPFEAGAVVVAEDLLSNARFKLLLPPATKLRWAVEQTTIPVANCALVVMVTSSTHRASTILLNERLTEGAEYPEEFALERATAELILNDRAGYAVTVAVVLLDQIPPAPLTPHQAGTWLARRVFRVSPEKQETSFSPEELTEEVRKTHNLPDGVLRFVAFDDLLAADDLSDSVHVYVEPSVLNWMLNNQSDHVVRQQEVELAILAYDMTAQMIIRQIRDEVPGRPLTEADLEPYPAAHRFMGNLAVKFECSFSELLSRAEDGQYVRPFLEAKFEATKFTLEALRD